MSKDQKQINVKIIRTNGADGKVSCTIKTEPYFETKDGTRNPMNAQDFEDYVPKHEIVMFGHGEEEKIIPITLVNSDLPEEEDNGKADDAKDGDGEDEEEDEDDVHEVKFKIRLEKPDENVKISKYNLCHVTILPAEKKSAVEEHNKLVEYFLENKELSWGGQFIKACSLSPQISEDNMVTSPVTLGDALTHFLTITWKVLFAFVPPVKYCGGYFAFFVALAFIGVVTMIVGDVAKVLGCVCGIPESITAITLVAMGTSLPDTFASMSVAKSSDSADAAIGNVTGSNSVNIFLGLGLPWIIAAHYAASNNTKYVTPPGNLGFSVIIFMIVSILCFILLIVRRLVSNNSWSRKVGSKFKFSKYANMTVSIYSSLEASSAVLPCLAICRARSCSSCGSSTSSCRLLRPLMSSVMSRLASMVPSPSSRRTECASDS